LRGKITTLEGYVKELNVEKQIQEIGAVRRDVGRELSKKVFIVHGHNGELKESTARLVSQLGLEPVILHEKLNQGRTIIEKFSDHAEEAGFCIGLLSADDEGRSRGVSPDPLKLRARQNVIFELGFFFGSLGRDRVCAVYEKDVESPSDIQGFAYIMRDEGGAWKYKVAKELAGAGYEIDVGRI
jgi:predicted nucleotide-binding protein